MSGRISTYHLQRAREADISDEEEAEAAEETAQNRREYAAEVLDDDKRLGDALCDWLVHERRYGRLAFAIQCALGLSGYPASSEELREVVEEVARAAALLNATEVTGDDIADRRIAALEEHYEEAA